MKKIILCCLTVATVLFPFVTVRAQQTLSPNLFSQNGWRPNQVGGGTTPTSTVTCRGLNVTPQLPCLVYGLIDTLWKPVQLSGAKFVRYGGTTVDQNQPNTAHYLAFIDSVRSRGMEPILQIPINQNDPSQDYDTTDAKNIIIAINSTNNRKVVYWIIGNEPDLKAPSGYNDSTPATAVNIANNIKNFSKAMRRAVPSFPIKIIGPELARWNCDPNYDMKKVVDSLVGYTNHGACDIMGKDPATNKYWIDYFSFHWYSWNGDVASPLRSTAIAKLRSTYNLDTSLSYLQTRIASANSYHSRTGSPVKVVITEANTDYQTNSTDAFNDVKANGFYSGQHWLEIASVAAENNVEFVNYWASADGSMGFLKSDGSKKSSYHHFKVVADNFVGCTNYYTGTDNDANIKVFGAKGTNHITVVVMNQDTFTAASKPYTIRLDNTTPGTTTWAKMNMGLNKVLTDTIKASSTTVLVYDCNGEIAKKYRYDQAGTYTPFQSVWAAASPATLFTASISPAIAKKQANCSQTYTATTTGCSGTKTYNWYAGGSLWYSSSTSNTCAFDGTGDFVITLEVTCSTGGSCNSATASAVYDVIPGTPCEGAKYAMQEESITTGETQLLSNVPNPTDGNTIINYRISNAFTKAEIRITDLYGKLIEVIPVLRGSTSVAFNCSDCANGIYFYSLIAENKLIATKKMLIAK